MDTNKSLLQEEWEASEGNIQTKQKQKLIQKQRRILKQIPRYSNKIQDKRETNTKENSGQTTKVVCPNPKKAGAMELSVCLPVCPIPLVSKRVRRSHHHPLNFIYILGLLN